jgi:predicted  nucleic acid-binding Zn-ribbon protein
LQKEKNSFDIALQNQVNQHVVARNNEILALDQQITLFKQQIAELESKIIKNEALIKSKNEQIIESDSKINVTKQNFEVTLHAINSEIDRDIDAINLYL